MVSMVHLSVCLPPQLSRSPPPPRDPRVGGFCLGRVGPNNGHPPPHPPADRKRPGPGPVIGLRLYRVGGLHAGQRSVPWRTRAVLAPFGQHPSGPLLWAVGGKTQWVQVWSRVCTHDTQPYMGGLSSAEIGDGRLSATQELTKAYVVAEFKEVEGWERFSTGHQTVGRLSWMSLP